MGWKLGVGKRERIGDSLVLGHLTSATRLDAGATFEPGGATALHADAEIAVRFERPAEPEDAWGAVGMFAIALELVDLGPGANAEEIVAANVFHRAFALGPANPEPPDGRARLLVGGEVRSSGPVPRDLPQRLAVAAGLLAGIGERFEAGDWVITGNVVQIPVADGDAVAAACDGLGSVQLRVASPGGS